MQMHGRGRLSIAALVLTLAAIGSVALLFFRQASGFRGAYTHSADLLHSKTVSPNFFQEETTANAPSKAGSSSATSDAWDEKNLKDYPDRRSNASTNPNGEGETSVAQAAVIAKGTPDPAEVDSPAPNDRPSRAEHTNNQSLLLVISRYDDDLHWILEDPSVGQAILPTEIYQIADLDPDTCEPMLPGIPRPLTPENVSVPPTWPDWSLAFIEEKCKIAGEVEPMTVFDAERRAWLDAGLPWRGSGKRRRLLGINEKSFDTRKLLKNGGQASDANEMAPSAPISDMNITSFGNNTSPQPVIIAPSVSPLPLHIIPQGREALVYLTAILTHYDDLPDLMLFMHGHESSFHTFDFGQRWVLERIRDLPPRNLSMGFMQLGCYQRDESFLFPLIVDANYASEVGPRFKESMAGHYLQAWAEGLGEIFDRPLPPQYIKAACCATFAVSRDAIQRRPKVFYEKLRNWMLGSAMDKYWRGIVMEFTWHTIFTGLDVYDPPVDQCRKELYDI